MKKSTWRNAETMTQKPKPTVSFEFFPPKSDAAAQALWENLPKLTALDPDYMTVTYGAGGSTRDKTLDVIGEMQKQSAVPIGMHLTYINTPRKELYKLADELWARGIRHLVALRGDMPDDLNWPLDNDTDYFQYTSHFVAALKARQDFEISVGAYPEKHPDADSMDKDIEALRKKCDAGADRAITQFFFDNDVYFKFLEQCNKAGIKTPIVPGVLPIHDFKAMCGFAARCHTHVPAWLHTKFDGLEDKPEEARKIAIDLLTRQVLALAEAGVPHFHFYSLNKADITTQACRALKGVIAS